MRYYFAYGSNLNQEAMAQICPNAEVVGKYKLKGYRLTFRGKLPDILPQENNIVTGGLWKITESDESALDQYEGHYGPSSPHNLYDKHFIEDSIIEDNIMFYRMARSLEEVPEDKDINTKDPIINRMFHGLRDFNITREELLHSLGITDEEELDPYLEMI